MRTEVKIYLDDYRTPPVGWSLAKTHEQFVELVAKSVENNDRITAIAFDHDLDFGSLDRGYADPEPPNGYDSVMWLINTYPDVLREIYVIILQTMSPSGGDRIWQALHQFYTNRSNYVGMEPPPVYRWPGWDHRANEGRYKINL